ncbi:hypothetical protein [Facilibium subflavum]|uniref:hypothetical protein n=1 Tax=Facilibium subflavum TaxID=2219058 RepID=UPI000E647984|nr:hypothetical protein [Facilibium subflavum]
MFKFKRTRAFVAKAASFHLFRLQHRTIIAFIQPLFAKKKPPKIDCEFDALEQHGIDDTKISQNYRLFCFFYKLFFVLSIIVLLYCIYLFETGAYHALLIGLGLLFVLLVHFFKFHFWAFQIQQKKLGCTFGEWWRFFIFNQRVDKNE